MDNFRVNNSANPFIVQRHPKSEIQNSVDSPVTPGAARKYRCYYYYYYCYYYYYYYDIQC